MALRSYLFVSTLLFSLGLSHAQLCPSDTFTYSESNCLSLTTSSTPSYDNASASCATDGASLVLISSEGELFAARGYTRSLGVRDGRYWIGYQYSSSNLVDVNGNPAPSIVVSAVEEGGPAPATGVCVALTQNEALVRVLCNESLDGYICQFTINVPLVALVSFNNSVIDPSVPITQPLGTSFILSCSFNYTTSRSTVQWTLNGAALSEELIDTNGDMSETTLNVTRFLSEGVYRCQVNNANERSVGQDIQIYASLEDTFFVPDPLSPNGIVAFPYTQSSILIQWFQPQVSYVSSPLLLRYTLYYTRNRDTDIGDRPVRTNLTTSPSGMGSYVLTGLDVGTEYYLTMSATNRAGTGDVLESVLIVRTFGTAPTTPPNNVNLSRNVENNALLATWDAVETTPPEGEVAFYQVEFKDMRSSIANTLFINPGFSFSSIFNVSNAQGYQVRVRTAVQSTANPDVTYVYSPYSRWASVSGIIIEVPSGAPTIIPVDDNNDRTLEIVIPAVVGGIVVAICIVLSILILYKIKSHNSTSPSATNEDFDMKKQLSDTDDAADGGDDGSGGGFGS